MRKIPPPPPHRQHTVYETGCTCPRCVVRWKREYAAVLEAQRQAVQS